MNADVMYQGKAMSLVRLGSGAGHLCFDLQDSSVNKFNRLTLAELRDVITIVAASDLTGLICTSAKSSFIVGADIGEFSSLFKLTEPELAYWCQASNAIFIGLEELAIPTVSAVSGLALGGGFELCLATDYRLATANAGFGFPEVGLGICPGFGGTVRAPRIMEFSSAVEWISAGRQYSAAQALSAGAIDAIIEPEMLLEAAIDLVEQARTHVGVGLPANSTEHPRTPVGAGLPANSTEHSHDDQTELNKLRAKKRAPVNMSLIDVSQVIETTQQKLAADKRNRNPAPARVVRELANSVFLDRDEALRIEQSVFVDLARSEIAGNLTQIFLNEQWLRQQSRKLIDAASPVARAGVLGAGIMGGGIAYQSALTGVPVVMKDIAQEGLDAGVNEASQLLHKQVSKGRMSEDKAKAVLATIHATLEYDELKHVDIVIEAVVENQRVKQIVLAEAEALLNDHAVLTSNTSTISITALATALKNPQRFCGMHFFNPVPLMPLVEIIRGQESSQATIATTVAYAQRLGKTPIVVNDCPGFLVNRILFPYFGAFSQLLRDGADFRHIDAAMEAFGWPMGPAWLLDVVGIDTAVHAQAVMAEGFPDRMAYDFKSAMDILFDAGHYGQKTGSGFYRYEKASDGRLTKVVDDKIVAQLEAASTTHKDFSAEEIVARMMVALCLETVRCLEDQIVSSPIEADMGLVLGLGFPTFRGGALRFIDSMGTRDFCALADGFAELGPLYEPTQGLRDMAANHKKFYEQKHNWSLD